MDAAFVTPFVAACEKLFSLMLASHVSPADAPPTDAPDLRAAIALSGAVSGSAVLALPRQTAERLVERFAGHPVAPDGPDLADAVGELANIICGTAKARFPAAPVHISCPRVTTDTDQPAPDEATTIPFDSDCGPFAIELTLRTNPNSATAAAA